MSLWKSRAIPVYSWRKIIIVIAPAVRVATTLRKVSRQIFGAHHESRYMLIFASCADNCVSKECYGHTCSFWTRNYQFTCQALKTHYGCDCSGCTCPGAQSACFWTCHLSLSLSLSFACACIAFTFVAGLADPGDAFESFVKPPSLGTVCQDGTFNILKEETSDDLNMNGCAQSCLGLDSCTHFIWKFSPKACELYDKFCEDPQPPKGGQELLFVRAVFPTTTSTSTSTSTSTTYANDRPRTCTGDAAAYISGNEPNPNIPFNAFAPDIMFFHLAREIRTFMPSPHTPLLFSAL